VAGPSSADVVREVYDSWARRDLDAFGRLADPEVELDMTDRVLNPAVYRGMPGLAQFAAEIGELWESMDIHVDRTLEHGDEVLAILTVRLRGRGSGVELESTIAQRWRLRAGRVVHMKLRQDAEAAEAEFTGAAKR